jgi:spermidine/putrescine transport system permease protein
MQNTDLLIRKIGRFGLWLNTGFAFAFLYLPIFILIIYSFNDSKINAVWQGFTLQWYGNLLAGGGDATLTDVLIWDAVKNSLLIGSISTIFATILGTMLAIALEKQNVPGKNFPGKGIIEAILFLPIIIPEITIGISLLVFFSLIFQLIENITGVKLVLGIPTVIIGHIAFCLAFVTITVRSRVAELDPSLEEAALDLGANEWRVLWRITLPLIWPAVFSAALLSFTLSLDDFVITFFTAGVGSTTLPLFVYGMIKFSVTPAINAISTLMLLASLILVLSSLSIDRHSRKFP